ncbi:hypothetical protein GW796_06030 [archaeon]|nr:hypothetical protein [archaeon]
MTVIANTNQRYLTSNNMSVYSLKQNTNQFLIDLAKLEQKNRIGNGYLNSIISESTMPLYWQTGGITSFVYNPVSRSSFVNISPSGSLSQNINFLNPNEEYTAIIFSTSPVAESLEFGVYADNLNQIFNVNDSLEINKATTSLLTSDSITKNIIQFKTNSTSVSGSVYVKLTNISASPQQIEIKKILVYKGLVELDDVMDSDVPEEDVYRSLIISDSLTIKSYVFFIYHGMLVQNEIVLPDYKKVYSVLINDSAVGVNETYRLRVFDGLLAIENQVYDDLVNLTVNVDDISSGARYDLKVINAVSSFEEREYLPSPYVLVDQAVSGAYLNKKYMVEVENDALITTELDPLSVPEVSDGFYIRDTKLLVGYLINILNGTLVLNVVAFDANYSFYKETKDYINNYDYRIYVENGIIKNVKVSRTSATPLYQFETFQEKINSVIDASKNVYSTSLLNFSTPIPSLNVPNNSIFLDSLDNIIKIKDNSGVLKTLY